MGAAQGTQAQAPTLGPPTVEQAARAPQGRGNEERQKSVKEQLGQVEREVGQIAEVSVDEDRVMSGGQNVYLILADRLDHDGDMHIGALPESMPRALAEQLREATAAKKLGECSSRMGPATPVDLGGGAIGGFRVQIYARDMVERRTHDAYLVTTDAGTTAAAGEDGRTNAAELTSGVTAGGAIGDPAAGGVLNGAVTHGIKASTSATSTTTHEASARNETKASYGQPLLDYEASLLMRLTLEVTLADGDWGVEETTFDAGSTGARSIVGRTMRSAL